MFYNYLTLQREATKIFLLERSGYGTTIIHLEGATKLHSERNVQRDRLIHVVHNHRA